MMPEALRISIQNTYRAWGLDENLAAPDATTSPEAFADILAAIADRIPDVPSRLGPSSFTPRAQLRAYPRPIQDRWTSCAEILRAFGSHGVMMRAPLFWQIEQTLFLACKDAGAFVFVNDQANMPLGLSAIERAEVDTVVTDADDASLFYAFLSERGSLPRLWIVIEEMGGLKVTLPEDAQVAREIHLFPGVPILVQCADLARTRSGHFHTDAAYLLESDTDGSARITSAGDVPLPLFRYRLSLSLERSDTCSCGRDSYAIN